MKPPHSGNRSAGNGSRGNDARGARDKDPRKAPKTQAGRPHKITKNHAFSAKDFKRGGTGKDGAGQDGAGQGGARKGGFGKGGGKYVANKREEIGAGANIRSSAKPARKGKSGVYRSGFTARPTLLINLDAIKSNYEALQEVAGGAKVAASVKADAYGLGAPTVSKTL